MDKKGLGALGVILIIAAVVVVGGFAFMVGDSGDALSVGADKNDGVVRTADVTPDLLVQAYDINNPGTAITEGTNLYRLKGTNTWSTFTGGTEVTGLIAGETYEFVMGISTSDFTDNAYGPQFEYTIQYKEDDTIEKGVYNDEIETSLAFTFYNADDSASTAETFSTGQSQNIYLKWEAGTDEVFGNPNLPVKFPNVVCLELNTTSWDAPESVSLHPQGDTLKKVSTPTLLTGSATDTAYCYEAPVITDAGQKIRVRLNADDTNAPSVDDTAYIFAGNWFINDAGDVDYGVETDDGDAVGADASDSGTMDFSA